MAKIILNAGHGGITLKKGYVTPGKRGPLGHRGQIFEGMSNRGLVHELAYLLSLKGHTVEVISHSTLDTSVGSRGRYAQEIKGDLLLDFHSNAMSDVEFRDYTGFELWTTEGETPSDHFAKHIAKGLKATYPHVRWRHGPNMEDDKEKNFSLIYMAEKVGTKAVLVETLFMDGVQDYNYLTDAMWRAKYVENFCNIIHKYP